MSAATLHGDREMQREKAVCNVHEPKVQLFIFSLNYVLNHVYASSKQQRTEQATVIKCYVIFDICN